MPTLFTALRAHRKPRKLLAPASPSVAPGGQPPLGVLGYTAKVVALAPPRAKKKLVGPTLKMSLRDRYMVRRYPKRGKVVVVGGGFAGLAAAYELESLGYEVVVLEGQGKVGGRVESRRNIVSGDVMEGGAELIGLNHPAWWSYKRKFKLHFRRLSDPADPPVYLGGQRIKGRDATELDKEVVAAQKRINRIAKRVDADEPWTSLRARVLDRMSLVQGLKRIPMSQRCRLAFIELLQTDNGVRADKQSWLGNLAMIKGGGLNSYWEYTETHHCVEGNQSLAIAFKNALEKVVLRARVSSVKVRGKRVVVALANGRKFEGDDVIVAIPPTMLKRMVFRPTLPRVYHSGQFGNNIKFLMNVRQGSWKPEAPNLSSDGPVDLTWNGTDGQPGRRAGLVAFSGADDAMSVRSWTERHFLKELGFVYPRLGIGCGRGVMMDWPGNKWTRGSYSFPRPGEVTRVGPLLRSGYLGRIHFAGEHTCYAFTGYMEGALESGIRAAEQIARRDGVLGKKRRTRSTHRRAKVGAVRVPSASTQPQTP